MNMNKDAKNPEEDWQGALFSTFEVDAQLPKKIIGPRLSKKYSRRKRDASVFFC